jgi:glutamine synthetase
VPVLTRDATDRNRTSPFAFTGNKFEFRMVGSSDSIAAANTTLNAIVAEAFCEAADTLEKADDFETACKALIKEYMTKHQRVVFNGDGYSDEWVAEAARRGLPNIASMVDAVPALVTDKAVALFEKFHIFTKAELESRTEVLYEGYAKVINIEAQTMLHMAAKHYIPSVINYTTQLANSIASVKAVCSGANTSVQEELLKQVSDLLAQASAAKTKLETLTAATNAESSVKDMATDFHDKVVPTMAELRSAVDQLELLVDKDCWPVPTYGDLMFEV